MIATRISTVASRTSTTNMLYHSPAPDARLDNLPFATPLAFPLAPTPARAPARAPQPSGCELQQAPLQLVQIHRLHQHPFRRYRDVGGVREPEHIARQEHHPGCKVWP